MSEPRCVVREVTLAHGLKGIRLSNPAVSVTVIPDKGADIYALVHRATGLDVLWKSPQGLRAPGQGRFAPDSATAWLEMYEGGWQEILPNGGDACQHNGVELSFHGESTTLPWQYDILSAEGDQIAVEFSVRLYRSPFAIRRRMSLNAEQPALFIDETVTNWGADAAALMWGHHPAFGAPFLSADTRLSCSARSVLVDDSYDPSHNRYVPGSQSLWPYVCGKDGSVDDLSVLPGADVQRDSLIYLLDTGESPWYALTNPVQRVGVGITWTQEVFRCLWLWQEVHATRGFPWYGQAYTVAVEPWSSYPGFGLAKVIDATQTHLTIPAGGALEARLCCVLFDAQPDQAPVNSVTPEGAVRFGAQQNS